MCPAYSGHQGSSLPPHADGTCVSASLNSLHMLHQGLGEATPPVLGLGSPEAGGVITSTHNYVCMIYLYVAILTAVANIDIRVSIS